MCSRDHALSGFWRFGPHDTVFEGVHVWPEIPEDPEPGTRPPSCSGDSLGLSRLSEHGAAPASEGSADLPWGGPLVPTSPTEVASGAVHLPSNLTPRFCVSDLPVQLGGLPGFSFRRGLSSFVRPLPSL